MRRGSISIACVVRSLVIAALVLACGYGAGTVVARLSQGAGIALPQLSQASASLAFSTWNQDEDTNYYRVLGPAQCAESPEPGTVRYGELDGLGRATGAVACVTFDSMSAGLERPRGDLSSVSPSGWGHNGEVSLAMPDGSVYHGYLFNRSHLVAKSLGGDDEAHNLITGTRTQNVGANLNGSEGGMAYAEGLARGWIASHPDGTLYYAATPVYSGDELVARSVLVDIKSDDGTVDQRIEVFNAARGFQIDYATGTFTVTEDAEAAAALIRGGSGEATDEQADAQQGERPAPTGSSDPVNGERKVIVTRSGKAYHHDESCRGLAQARSMEWVTVSEAEAMGRHACGICGG